MIDRILQYWLEPVARRQRMLYLRQKLSITWLAAAIFGIALLLLNKFWGWSIVSAAGLLCGLSVIVTLIYYRKSLNQRPDFKAIALHIEKHHPDLQALLLTAIQQHPQTPEAQLNYLQERVINEAIRHAHQHNWMQTVSQRRLTLANYGRWAAGILFVIIASQLFPPISFVASDDVATAGDVYRISVSPGDAEIELGSPVVITARFEGRVPSDAALLTSPAPEEINRIPMSKNLEDPVFGTILPEVNQNLVYWIEYADRRSENYDLTVYTHPELLRADARIIYPSYADLPEKTINDTRHISILEGSQVIFDFKLNKPVTSAQLVDRDGGVIDLTARPEAPEIYGARIEPSQSQRYELKLVDAQDRANKVPPRITVEVQANLPPELKATFPNSDLQPSPLEELTFEAEVWDDYGVTEYGYSYTVAGGETKTIAFEPQTSQGNKNILNHLLELEKLQVEPDQLLTYYYWARDVGPDNNPREAASDLFFVEIRPFEEIFRQSQSFQDQQNQQQNQDQEQDQNQQDQQSQRQNNEELIELQKQIISATWNLKRQADLNRKADTFTADVETIHQSQLEVLEKALSGIANAENPQAAQALQQAVLQVESALEQLARARDADSAEPLLPALSYEQAAYQEFLKLRQREYQVARSQNPSRQNQSSASQQTRRQMQQLEMQQRENRYETERQASLNDNQNEQRENLQVQNRLSELARRQNDVRERLQELQSELQQADERQREDLQRELRRLQEDQQQLLRDMDELQQRMNQPQNRQRMADANQQLSQTRQNVQQATEELEQGMLSQAVTSTSRAQRELEQIRDDFRRQAANQFAEQMRQMREQAQQLDRRQQEIAETIRQEVDNRQRSLADSEQLNQLNERINQQRETVEDIMDQMRQMSEEAEEPEPLLSRRLYETIRQTNASDIDQDLEIVGELVRQRFLNQAQDFERQPAQEISQLRRGVEQAAESVLGSEAESLRQAQRELDELIRQVQQEADQAQGVRPPDEQRDRPEQLVQDLLNRSGLLAADPNGADINQENQNQDSRNRPPQNQENQNRQDQNRQNQNQNTQSGQGGQRQITESRNRSGQDSQQRGAADQNAQNRRRSLTDPDLTDADRSRNFEFRNEWGENPNGPIRGQEYQQWADRMRDVEEMLEDADLSSEVARIRELVRRVRTDVKRHGDEPQWDLVRTQVINPMVDLYRRISEELARLESDEAMVPIDRDPVPQRFIDLVRIYYETLGKDKDKK